MFVDIMMSHILSDKIDKNLISSNLSQLDCPKENFLQSNSRQNLKLMFYFSGSWPFFFFFFDAAYLAPNFLFIFKYEIEGIYITVISKRFFKK